MAIRAFFGQQQEPIAAFGETPVFSRKVCRFFIYPGRTLEEERRSLMTVERRDRNIVQRSVCLVPEQLGYQKWSEDWFRACNHPRNGQIMEQTFSSEKFGLESESVTPSCTRNHPLSTALLFHPDKSKMYAIDLHGCSRTTHKNCYMGFVNDKWCLTGMPTVASSFIALWCFMSQLTCGRGDTLNPPSSTLPSSSYPLWSSCLTVQESKEINHRK